MIITKTPFRMSFFGGGTDMEDYFREHKGAVLSTTFDKYCYVAVRHLPEFFDYKTELVYSQIERVNSVDEIQHPTIRNAMKMLDIVRIRLDCEFDLPPRSGLGTSSAIAVGMLNAFHALKGEPVDKRRLADEAIFLERSLCGETGGWQDQIAAAFGGFNRIDFEEGSYRVSPVALPPENRMELNRNLLLFFTGFSRNSSEIQKLNRVADKKNYSTLKQMYELVDEAEKILVKKAGDMNEFGRLLDLTWEMKKKTGKAISTGSIELLYEKGKAAGALGGKLLGAGSGGFLLFYTPPDRQENVKRALEDLRYIPFEFEEEGAGIVYHAPERAQVG